MMSVEHQAVLGRLRDAVGQCDRAFRRDRGHAWISETSSPRCIIVQEVAAEPPKDRDAIADALTRALHQLDPSCDHRVVLVAANSLPSRSDVAAFSAECRRRYDAGMLPVVDEFVVAAMVASDPGAETKPISAREREQALVDIWSDILAVEVGAEDRFVDFTDSFGAVEFVNRVRERFDVDISPIALFDEIPTIAAVSEVIHKSRSSDAGHADE